MVVGTIAGIVKEQVVIVLLLVVLVGMMFVVVIGLIMLVLVVFAKTHAATHTKVEHCAWKAAASLF